MMPAPSYDCSLHNCQLDPRCPDMQVCLPREVAQILEKNCIREFDRLSIEGMPDPMPNLEGLQNLPNVEVQFNGKFGPDVLVDPTGVEPD